MARCLLRIDDRRPQHLLDAQRAGCQHHQPIEAERNAGGRRHLGERAKKILIERITLAVHPLFLRHLGFEAAASVLLGVTASGFYVRNAQSPSIDDLVQMLRVWPSKDE